MTSLFPLGLASGEAFYDRVNERAMLQKNIENVRHTALIAPRRFGKTSLIKKVLDENEIHYIWLDFMAITSKEEAQQRFLNHISELIVKIVKGQEALLKKMLEYFTQFKPELTLGIPGIFNVSFKAEKISHAGVTDALLMLDQLAQDHKIRLAVVCDEFQEIVNIDKEATLQASIRHAAERSKAITYLFSGSKHRPLRRLFSGKENPLYALCELFSLERISEEDYRDYLQKEAKNKWKNPLSEEILKKIFSFTDYYPKYINALCAKLWFSDQTPTLELVEKLWENYIFSKKTDIVEELNDLTLNQRKLLRYLCYYPTTAPYSHETSKNSGLSVSTIQSALPILLDKDFVLEIEGSYRVLDPTFKYYFEKF